MLAAQGAIAGQGGSPDRFVYTLSCSTDLRVLRIYKVKNGSHTQMTTFNLTAASYGGLLGFGISRVDPKYPHLLYFIWTRSDTNVSRLYRINALTYAIDLITVLSAGAYLGDYTYADTFEVDIDNNILYVYYNATIRKLSLVDGNVLEYSGSTGYYKISNLRLNSAKTKIGFIGADRQSDGDGGWYQIPNAGHVKLPLATNNVIKATINYFAEIANFESNGVIEMDVISEVHAGRWGTSDVMANLQNVIPPISTSYHAVGYDEFTDRIYVLMYLNAVAGNTEVYLAYKQRADTVWSNQKIKTYTGKPSVYLKTTNSRPTRMFIDATHIYTGGVLLNDVDPTKEIFIKINKTTLEYYDEIYGWTAPFTYFIV